MAALLGVAAAALSGAGSVAPVAAQTAPSSTPTFVSCAATQYRLLFWPKGHKAVKSQGFPDYPIPHAELYSGTGKVFADADYLGYVDATGASAAASTCTPGALTGANGGGAIPADKLVTATKPMVLSCTVPNSSVLIVPNAQGKAVLSVVITGESPAYATMTPTGSQLAYDKTMCTPGKVPKK